MGLDSVELILDVEKEFGVEIGDAEAAELATVGDLHACIARKLASQSKAEADVWARLVRLLATWSGIPPERIAPDTEIAGDLGIE